MSEENLVTPLSTTQVDQEIHADKTEGTPHRVIEMVDATAESAVGPQDHTISSATATEVVEGKHGFLHSAAVLLDKGLNAVSPDHGEKALIADDVRAIEEQKRDEAVLNQIGGGVVAEIHKEEGLN